MCITPTLSSTSTFNLPVGQVIYDRTSGATLFNESLNLSSTASASTATQTSTASSATNTASPDNNIVPVAVGLGVSLGVLFLISLAAAIVFFRQNRVLRKKIQEREQAYRELPKPAGLVLEALAETNEVNEVPATPFR